MQLHVAKDYLTDYNKTHQRELRLCQVYRDMGTTGTKFRRPGFDQLLEDIRSKKINCVLVKDLSRFGRNYLETGNYLERIFPELGVRFIAVSEGYDSDNTKQLDYLGLEIRNLVNELYARDFSMKAKQQIRQRREAGHYVGAVAPYGYKCSQKEGLRCLVVDEKAAWVVRKMFALFQQTGEERAVLQWLWKFGIHPPLIYHRTGKLWSGKGEENGSKKWGRTSVHRILRNPRYQSHTIL